MVQPTGVDHRPIETVEPQKVSNEFKTVLQHLSNLSIDSPTRHMRLTNISCEIGVVSRDVDMLEQLIEAGMNIARLTFNTGTHDFHLETVENIREAVKNVSLRYGYEFPVAIALDSKGPEIRTGVVKGELFLVTGNMIKVTTNVIYSDCGDENIIWIDYMNIVNTIRRGDLILIDNGYISLKVKDIVGDTMLCRIESGGRLTSRKNVNLPGVPVDLPTISDKDRLDFAFAVKHNFDIIFASFIRNAAALHEIREIIGPKGQKLKIISKIENQQGLENFAEIVAASDGIMIARGDMGNEVALEKVFLAQKFMAAKCNQLGVPVVCSYHFVISMLTKPSPSRSEVCDIANAVLDGVDCISVSAETCKGTYPREVVQTVAKICKEAEASFWHKLYFRDLLATANPIKNGVDAIGYAAVDSSISVKAVAIIVSTDNGAAAYSCSKYRPSCPILSVSRDPQVVRQANLYRGVIGVICNDGALSDPIKDANLNIEAGIKFAKQKDIVRVGETVILITGWQQGTEKNNFLRIVFVE